MNLAREGAIFDGPVTPIPSPPARGSNQLWLNLVEGFFSKLAHSVLRHLQDIRHAGRCPQFEEERTHHRHPL
jgi:hypothetical protein